MNKLEQVSTDDHQMSLAGWVGEYFQRDWVSRVYPYHATYPMMHVMLPTNTPPPVDGYTPVKTLPSRGYSCGRYILTDLLPPSSIDNVRMLNIPTKLVCQLLLIPKENLSCPVAIVPTYFCRWLSFVCTMLLANKDPLL